MKKFSVRKYYQTSLSGEFEAENEEQANVMFDDTPESDLHECYEGVVSQLDEIEEIEGKGIA
jgi:hypothetical protein